MKLEVALLFLLSATAIADDAGKTQVYCKKNVYCVESTKVPDGQKLVLVTMKLGEISFRMDGPNELFNPTVPFPVIVAVKRNTSTELTVLRKFEPKNLEKLKFEFKWGRFNAVLTDNVFALPYDSKNSFPIIQGYNGPITHSGEKQWAVDFGMTEGMDILAARAGVVVKVIQDFNQTAVVPDDYGNANNILILHDDGTIAAYHHLLYKSALVKEGESVSTGQKIARSGMTGRAKSPHLHFDVNVPINWSDSRRTQPIKFKLPSGKVLPDPQQGMPYP